MYDIRTACACVHISVYLTTLESVMSTHSSEQPTSYGRPFDILYTNEPPINSRLHQKATFAVSQGWLLIVGSIVPFYNLLGRC